MFEANILSKVKICRFEFQELRIGGFEAIHISKDFQPDDRSKNFGGFLTCLYCFCDDSDEDYENDLP